MSSAPKTPEKMLIHVSLYTKTGKWKYGFNVELLYSTTFQDHKGLLEAIDGAQHDVIPGVITGGGYFVVLDDHPEQARNPTGSFFLNRLYTPEMVRRYCS